MSSRPTNLFLVLALIIFPVGAIAQSKLPSAPAAKLTDREKAGEYLFLQRCSLCHLAPYSKAVDWTEPKASPPPIGPRLAGVLDMETPEQEKAVRDFILKGTRNMPGWQYTLDANQIDDLITYLKTLQRDKTE